MVAMNKWQDITDTEVCQGAKWLVSIAAIHAETSVQGH